MAKPTQSETTLTQGPNSAARRHPDGQPRAYIGIPGAATYLDVDHKTIRRLITSGKLRGYRLGNRVIKVKVADLDAVLTPIGGAV
ncbi:helix-turn-helix domain-containing protein [Mycobacterium intracellulare]|uniref:helix-turn-helix domain-containing protein n=1 Tax=Mycobacterium intracellulare TaxID=1767 RepID=UPI0034D3F8BE